MNNKNTLSDHIEKYVAQIYDLLAIVISDAEGVHISSAFNSEFKQKQQKIIQISTMLISTISQCQGNLDKIHKTGVVNPITLYYDQFLMHFRKTKIFNVTLVMRPKAGGLLAEQISSQLINNFSFLNGALGKKE